MNRRQLLPLVALLLIVSVLLGNVSVGGTGMSRLALLNVGWTLASFWAAISCGLRARRETERHLRWAWRFFALGSASWCTGQILWSCEEIFSGQTPAFAALPDAVFAGTGPFLFAGFYFLSGRNTTAVGTTRKLCNLAIISCSVMIIVLPLCREIVLTAESEPALMLTAIGGGVLIIGAFFGGLLCLWLYTPRQALWHTSILVTASGLIMVATLSYATQSVAGSYSSGTAADYLYFIAFILISAAAKIRYKAHSTKPSSALQRSIHLAYTEAAITGLSMLAVLTVVLLRRHDFNSLLPYAVPGVSLLAICVAVREAWNARLEQRLFDKLGESERRFRALVEHASDGIAAWDTAGIIRYATASNAQLIGMSPEELVGTPVRALFHPEDAAAMEAALLRALQNPGMQVPVKARVQHKDGGWRHCEGVLTNLLHDPAVSSLVVNYHDITERQRAEDALGESKAHLRAFMENNPSHLFIKDREGRYLHVNRRWLEAVGSPLEGVLGRTDWEIFPQDLARSYVSSDAKTFAEKKPLQFEEVVVEGAETLTSIVQKFPLRDATGEITSLGGIVTDITERVRAEQSLRRSEERYRNLVDGARDAIFTLSPEGLFTSANPAAELLTGVPNQERLGKSLLTMVIPEDAPRAIDALQDAITGKKPEPIELLVIAANGRKVLLEVTASPQFDGGQVVGVLCIGRDITERQALQEKLQHAQKMESVGQLAGGVAHDFNNLLTVILGNASMIEDKDSLPASVTECVQQISEASERAAALTRQLLAFSRRQVIRPCNLDLNKVIDGLANMLRSLLKEDIRLRIEGSANLPFVHADAGMIEQVLVNLAVNARDAMSAGGDLSIRTDHVKVSEGEARKIPGACAGSFVRVSITDTGEGIAPEHISHIFEPFYTTKEVGKGTGLGLATVYGVVQQHQGWISVESTLGSGTTFHIHLPVQAIHPEIAPETPQTNSPLPRGCETILLVEDEAPLRGMVKTVLTRLGYRVIEAETGRAAMELWPWHRHEIDLVFTDMVMPDGLSGQQLVEELRRDRPELPVLFTTGYSAQMVARNGGLPPNAGFLQKPYLPTALAGAVRGALNGQACSSDLAKAGPHLHHGPSRGKNSSVRNPSSHSGDHPADESAYLAV